MEEIDIGVEVSCADDLKQFCQTKARITQSQVDPAKCIPSGKGVKTAKANKMTNIFLKTKLTNGRDTKQKCDVVCHLKSLVNESVNKCDVNQIQCNEYRIQYTPTIHGLVEYVDFS